MSYPLVSVVIVTYNSKQLIERCLAPFVATNLPDFDVIIWDNCSTDGTAEYVSKLFPYFKLIRSPNNIGFAAANNSAFELCSGKYVLLLNPDAFLKSLDQIYFLLKVIDSDERIAAVGPRLTGADGSNQVGASGWRVNLFNIASHFLFFHKLFHKLPSLYLSNARLLKARAVDVDWVAGTCLLVRRGVIDRVGGLNQRIFMYGEDIEWGQSMRSAGFRVVYVPMVSVLHLGGGTQRKESEIFFSTGWLDYLAGATAQHGSILSFVCFKFTVVLGLSIRALALWTLGAFSRNERKFAQSRVNWSYAKHVAQLRRPV